VFAADLVALLDRLELDQVVVGGLSMGGQIAMEFAHQHPERLRGLLLADTFAQGETPEGRATRNAMADRLQREGMAGYADEVLTKMITPANAAALPEVAAHVLGMMRGAPPEGAAAALRGRALRRDYRATLPAVAVPTLVVVGAADEYTPVADAELIAGLVPDARLVVIPDAGHLPNLERPEEFNHHLGAFLTTLGAIAA
jgi:pimeloyl-ACP methyl ester carboxylesterase